MSIYRGKQTLAHFGIGLGISGLTSAFFGASGGEQLMAAFVYGAGRELEDLAEGEFRWFEDSVIDFLEILAGAAVGVVIQLVVGIFA